MAPKLAHEERQLTSLMQAAGGSPSAKERKEIAAQEAFVEELRALLDEVKRVAPLWNPTSTTASCSPSRRSGGSFRSTSPGRRS